MAEPAAAGIPGFQAGGQRLSKQNLEPSRLCNWAWDWDITYCYMGAALGQSQLQWAAQQANTLANMHQKLDSYLDLC